MAAIVRLAHTMFGAGNAPLTLGIEQGFFADEGIEVDRREVSSGTTGIANVIDREVDICVCGGVPILRAALEGGDPVIVMSIEAENVVAVMGARHISTPDQLRGTVMGVTGLGDPDNTFLRRALRDWGIDPEQDVTFREYSNRGAVWSALVAGEIGAMAATIPQPILARKIGLPVLRDFSEIHEPYQVGTMVTSRRFADESPDLLRRFLAGALRGIELFQSDFDVSLPHLKARSKLDDVDVLRETHRLFGDAMRDYVPRVEPIRAVARDYALAIGKPVDLDFDAMVDASFVPQREAR
jgi:NitT/TauT family transport system substrate-binding protein